MKKILYLPIETIVRELDARLLLAHQAINRGYSVIIGHKHNVLKAGTILGSGVYFNKAHGPENFPKNKPFFNSNIKYVALDEEGLVFVDDNEYIRSSKPNAVKHLDILFTWGQHQRNLLIKENPELKSKTAAVGNPRFDLLRKEFMPLYDSISRQIIKRWGKYIMITTRFAPGNYSRLYGIDYVEAKIHKFIRFIGRPPTEDEKNFIIEEAKYYQELFNQYAEMFKILSEKFPDINFILRPHPSEDILNWKMSLKGLDNVHVIFEGTAIDWIIGAIALIHTGCTTGIEAWALKKPVIAYNPNKKADIEPPLPNKFGYNIKNIENLCEILSEIISGKPVYSNSKINDGQFKLAGRYIESISGKYSATRFLDALDEKLGMNTVMDGSIEYHELKKLKKMESLKKTVKFIILKFLSKYQPTIVKVAGNKLSDFIFGRFKKYPGLMAEFKKFPGLGIKEINYKLHVYDSIIYGGNYQKYQVNKIATDTYLISQKI